MRLLARRIPASFERLVALEIQDQLEPGVHVRHELRWNSPDALLQVVLIEGNDVRDVGDGVSWQARVAGREEYVSRRIEEPHVRREDHAEDRLESASIEGVGLNDEQRMSETGFQSSRLIEVGPPNLSALDYHSGRPTLRACARRKAESMPLGSSPKTSLRRAVTSWLRCLATYSATAVA